MLDLQALMVPLGNKAFKVNKDHVALKATREILVKLAYLENRVYRVYRENKGHVALKATKVTLAQTEQTEQTVKQDHRANKASKDYLALMARTDYKDRKANREFQEHKYSFL